MWMIAIRGGEVGVTPFVTDALCFFCPRSPTRPPPRFEVNMGHEIRHIVDQYVHFDSQDPYLSLFGARSTHSTPSFSRFEEPPLARSLAPRPPSPPPFSAFSFLSRPIPFTRYSIMLSNLSRKACRSFYVTPSGLSSLGTSSSSCSFFSTVLRTSPVLSFRFFLSSHVPLPPLCLSASPPSFLPPIRATPTHPPHPTVPLQRGTR